MCLDKKVINASSGLTQKIGFHNKLEVYGKERAMNCPTTNALTSKNEQSA